MSIVIYTDDQGIMRLRKEPVAHWRRQNLRAQAERRAVKLNARTEPYARTDIYTRDNGICHSCGAHVPESEWHCDHLIPLQHPGVFTEMFGDCAENVAVSCAACNISKGNRTASTAKWYANCRAEYVTLDELHVPAGRST